MRAQRGAGGGARALRGGGTVRCTRIDGTDAVRSGVADPAVFLIRRRARSTHLSDPKAIGAKYRRARGRRAAVRARMLGCPLRRVESAHPPASKRRCERRAERSTPRCAFRHAQKNLQLILVMSNPTASQTTGAAEGFAAAASAASAPSDDRQQQQQKLQQSANASAPLDDPSANLRAHLYRLSWTARQGNARLGNACLGTQAQAAACLRTLARTAPAAPALRRRTAHMATTSSTRLSHSATSVAG